MAHRREPRDRAAPARARGRSGFTLLEVLAAVAILGIWFTVLAGVAIQGLRAEGGNERLIRASLAADAVLTDLEAQIAAGVFPVEDEEIEQDEFQVAVRVTPFADAAFQSSEYDLAGFIAENLDTVNPDLYEVTVEVNWIEGVDEQQLLRTTYAWDATAYLEAFSLPGSGEQPGEAAAPAEESLQ